MSKQPPAISKRSPWFLVDSELWQEPGDLKLDWATRKLAIYLRDAEGKWPIKGKKTDHVVVRAQKTICADFGISKNQLKKSIERLRVWPSRRRRFIKSYQLDGDNLTLILRPIPKQKKGTHFVRVYRWLWESNLPDAVKDIVLFTRTRFEGKDADDNELFSLRMKGDRQPSILRCCYLGGLNSKLSTGNGRHRMVSKVVRTLEQSGLVTVVKRSTSQRPMVVKLNDSKRSETVSKLLCSLEVTSKQSTKLPAKPHEVTSEYSPKLPAESRKVTTLQTPFHTPSSNTILNPPSEGSPEGEPQGGIKSEQERDGYEELRRAFSDSDSEEENSFLDELLLDDGEQEEDWEEEESDVPREPLKRNPPYHDLLQPEELRFAEMVEQECSLQSSYVKPAEVAEFIKLLFNGGPAEKSAEPVIAAMNDVSFEGINSKSWGYFKSLQNRFLDVLEKKAEPLREAEERDKERQARLLELQNSPDASERREAARSLAQLLRTETLLNFLQDETDESVLMDVANYLAISEAAAEFREEVQKLFIYRLVDDSFCDESKESLSSLLSEIENELSKKE